METAPPRPWARILGSSKARALLLALAVPLLLGAAGLAERRLDVDLGLTNERAVLICELALLGAGIWAGATSLEDGLAKLGTGIGNGHNHAPRPPDGPRYGPGGGIGVLLAAGLCLGATGCPAADPRVHAEANRARYEAVAPFVRRCLREHPGHDAERRAHWEMLLRDWEDSAKELERESR